MSKLKDWAKSSDGNLRVYLTLMWLLLVALLATIGVLIYLLAVRAEVWAAIPLFAIFYLWYREVFGDG